ncbi:ABATE domain-containing protein [Kribbella sp. VKM Ac-2566]|uniref:CGNR zinc finger domain-containing protein n=1 Tax=Kribbella sp. VKM Ac-2566 TaxID=2512218 RepID=UPI00106352DD|nr:ABATE domain-containing protein [Kribbella sp. VKM Ac-2566]
MSDIELGKSWTLADPQLAVALLSTLRLRDGELVDELADRDSVTRWLDEVLADRRRGAVARRDLVALRELLRNLLTEVVDGVALSPAVIATVNEVAARAPVTLVARVMRDGEVEVQATSKSTASDSVLAQLARSALSLLAAPDRDQLGLCRAPGCILFFLKHHPKQQWCSPGCGNRARVARHHSRHSRS